MSLFLQALMCRKDNGFVSENKTQTALRILFFILRDKRK